MKNDIRKVLVSSERIQRRVKRIAGDICRDYRGQELVAVAVLKGSVLFFSDLLKSLPIPCGVDFISVSSYEGTESSGRIRLLRDVQYALSGKHVLLVEDIADSGRTLDALVRHVRALGAASVRTCVLLDKECARVVPVTVDYRAFTIPDEFVVGYGLDYRERYRNLPYIAVLKPEVYRGSGEPKAALMSSENHRNVNWERYI